MTSFDSESLYRLFIHVMKLHFQRSHVLLEAVGLHPGQPPMLYALHVQDGQSQTELAERLSVSPATITMMLKRLERDNLVERRQDPDDRRVSRVYLTNRGQQVFADLESVMKSIEAECFAGFSKEDRGQLHRLLLAMRRNLENAATS